MLLSEEQRDVALEVACILAAGVQLTTAAQTSTTLDVTGYVRATQKFLHEVLRPTAMEEASLEAPRSRDRAEIRAGHCIL